MFYFFLQVRLVLPTLEAQQKTPAKKSTTAKTSTTSKDSTAVRKPGMKKNGTPDMRYKANKTNANKTVTGPLKKDSTPDMRYKANKAKAK